MRPTQMTLKVNEKSHLVLKSLLKNTNKKTIGMHCSLLKRIETTS